MKFLFNIFMTLIICISLVGCFVPRGTGLVQEITHQDSAKPENFNTHTVDSEFIEQYLKKTKSKARTQFSWPEGHKAQRVIKPGDTFKISIWETASSSLYLTLGQKNITLPLIRVNHEGYIQIPYAEDIKVTNLTNIEAVQNVKKAIKFVSPSAEVQVEIQSGPENSYSLVGDIARPGFFSLPVEGILLKEAIALAGDLIKETRNPYLILERDGNIHKISYENFLINPVNNIEIFPKDFIRIESDKREFQILGSSGKGQVIRFDTDRISVRKAIASAGGLDSGRSNPKGILLLRNNKQKIATTKRYHKPEIFIFDLTNGESIFAADEFLIEENDLIMMTESPVPSIEAILGLIAMGASVLK
jgi:polysaccharide biosynthesis/export protein